MSGSAFDLSDEDLLLVSDEVAQDEFDELLAGPAGAVTLRHPDHDPALNPLYEWLDLVEAAYAKKVYDAKKHPRWPKGTERAGQFMRTGESFMSGGKRWQIISTAGNVVRAAEASGDVKAVEEKVFKATQKITGSVKEPGEVKKLPAPKPLAAAWVKDPGKIPEGTQLKYGGTTMTRVPAGFMRDSDGYVYDLTYWKKFNSLSGWEVVAKSGAAQTVSTGEGVAVPGITDAPAKRLKGGNYSADNDFHVSLPGGENTTVVSPYVDPKTHDPKLALPSTSKLTAEEWKRFGDKDQTYYTELMSRFGAWNPADAKKVMEEAYNSYDASVRDTLYDAFSKQYGPGYWGDVGGGRSLNLAFLFEHRNDGPKLEEAWKKYEKNKLALDEMNEVVHWDLYNRTRSPDITLFHGGYNKNNDYEKKYIAGKVPIYAGYSQSYSLKGGEGWGDYILATPVAIPNISLSVYTPPPGHGMQHEKEVAVGVRMKLDNRSATWNSANMGMGTSNGAAAEAVRSWLQSKTAQQPVGGWIIDDLKDVWAGKGPIPIPEEPLALVHLNKSGDTATWTPLTASTTAEVKGMAASLKYKSEDGSKEGAVGILDTMGLQAGDFIEGKQGARYIIVKDSTDKHGLRYVKVISSSGQIVAGDLDTSFGFEASQGNEFYRLDGHIDLPQPKPVKGWTPWTEDQYNALSKGEKKQVNKIPVDGLFTYDKEIYKVTGPMSLGKVPVQSMQNGEKYNANSLGVVVEMVPTSKFKPPDEYKPGDKVVFSKDFGPSAMGDVIGVDAKAGTVDVQWGGGKLTIPNEQVSPAPDLPGVTNVQKGDKFAFNGKGPYTVTTVLKSGTVKAKLSGGSVQAFTAMDLKDNAVVYRPSTFAFGDKVKLKDLPIGAVVSGSPKVVRPYIVEGHVANKVYLRNLETGEFSGVSKNKSYPHLLTAAEIQAQKEAVPPPGATKPSNTVFDPDDYTLGATTTVDQLEIGDKFKGNSGAVYEITGPGTLPGKVYTTNKLTFDKQQGIQFSGGVNATPLIPKALAPFDHSKLKHGDLVKPGDLKVGDLFQPIQDKGTKQGKIFAVKGVYDDGSVSGTEVNGTQGYGTNEDEMVKYVAPNAPVAQPVEIDPAKLPVADIAFYKWHKSGGGGYTYPKLKAMAVGTVFTDKNDKPWKVKESGAGGVVVTDGTTLFQADGDWRGKLSDADVAFVDKTGDGGTLPVIDAGVGLFDLPVGHTVTTPSGAYITHVPKTTVGAAPANSTKNWLVEVPGQPPVATAGAVKAFKFAMGQDTPPQSFIDAGKELVGIHGSKLPGAAPAKEKRLKEGDPLVSSFPTYGDLPVGTKFTAGSGDPTLYTVGETAGGKTYVTWGTSGKYDYPSDNPTPDSWVLAEIPKTTGDATGPLEDGDNLLAKFPTKGEIPPGTKFVVLSGSTGSYTVHEKDANGMVVVTKDDGGAGPWSYPPGDKTTGTWNAKVTSVPSPKAVTIEELPVGATFLNKAADGHVMWPKFGPGDAVMTKVSHNGGSMQVKGPVGTPFSVAANSQNGQSLVVPEPADPPAVAPGAQVSALYPNFGDIPEGTWLVGLDGALPFQIKQGDSVTHLYDAEDLHVNEFPKDLKVAAFWTFGEPPAKPEVEGVSLPANFQGASGELPADDMGAFSFGIADGKVVYKAHNGSFYEVGKKDPIPTPTTVGAVDWTGPVPPSDPAVLKPFGDPVPLATLESGAFFKKGENVFQVIGQGSDGTTGKHLGDWQFVAFDASNPDVQPLVDTEGAIGAGPEPEPEPMHATELQPGDIFTIGDQHKNAEHAVYQFVSPPKDGKPTQIRLVTPSVAATNVKPGDVIDWGSGTQNVPSISVMKHGHESLGPEADPEPVGTIKVPISHVSQMQVGDQYDVDLPNVSLTWKVVSKEAGGGVTIKVIKASPGATLSVGDEQTMDGPLNVTVRRPSTVPAYLLKTTISDPPDLKAPFGDEWKANLKAQSDKLAAGTKPKLGDKLKGAYGSYGDVPVGTTFGMVGSPTSYTVGETAGGKTKITKKTKTTRTPLEWASAEPVNGAWVIKGLPQPKPQVGDKVMAAFPTNGDIPEGTVIGSENSGPFTVHQAAVLTHFLNSMGTPAMKDPKGDVPFGLWKILKLPGEPAAESGWQVGDVIKHQNGPVYEIKTVHPDGAVSVGYPEDKKSLYTYTADETQGFLNNGLWTKNPTPDEAETNPLPAGITAGMLVGDGSPKNGPAEVIGMGTEGLKDHVMIKYTSGPLQGIEGAITPSEIAPAPPLVPPGGDPTAVESPLKPYKYHKSGGGGYSYPKLGTLAPGTIFTDKTKTKYRVVSTSGDTTYFEKLADGIQDNNPQYAAPAKSFVHVLSDGDVEEARLVYLTSGRIALAA